MPKSALRITTLIIGSLLGCAAAPAHSARSPELILAHGHLITEDETNSVAQAVAISHGRIVAIGSDAPILALATRSTKILDLHGLTATPGLIDTHAHLAEGGVDSLLTVDLSTATSVSDIQKSLAKRAKALSPGQWLIGTGWDEGKLKERRYITASDIDAVSGDHPVWLEHTTGHYGSANTAALKLAGVTLATPNPTAGTIDREGDGRASGVLKESAMSLVVKLIPPATSLELRQGIINNLKVMASEGMTGIKDPNITLEDWQAYQFLANAGKLSAHVCVLWHSDSTLADAKSVIRRLKAIPLPPAVAAPNLMSCGIKLFMDGSGGARTAWMYQDWNKKSIETDAGNKGYPSAEPAAYREVVREYHNAGFHVATHAIGDRAIDWVVDTYANVLEDNPISGLRHAIIHANTPTPHAIEVMQSLQSRYDAGYPETQGGFTWWIGDNYAGNLGPVRGATLNPYASYLAHGIRFGGGSDYPVTPLPARLGLWASVAREPLLGTYGLQPFGSAESITAADALRSYTVWAAHQLFLDQETGSLEIGKSADIAVWDRDPTSVETARLKDMHCELTLFRGKIVYKADAKSITPLRKVSKQKGT